MELTPLEGIVALVLLVGWFVTGCLAGWAIGKSLGKKFDDFTLGLIQGVTALFVTMVGSLLTAWMFSVAFGY